MQGSNLQATARKQAPINQTNKHIVQAPFLFTPFLHKAGAMLLRPGDSDMVLSTPPYLLCGDSHESWGATPFCFIGQLQRAAVGQKHKGSSQNLLPSAPFLQLKCLEGLSYPGRRKSCLTMHLREKYDALLHKVC